jgi:hypothetical protein
MPQSEVLRAGEPTGRIIEGAMFEAALRWHEYVLLFLTDGIPFEEGLGIYLLDENLNIIDSVCMAHMYSSGVFSDLDLTQDDTVRFRFFGGTIWTLTLFAEKRFALPFISDPIGVHRAFKFSRRFRLISTPAE